jgi:hypothetical protein
MPRGSGTVTTDLHLSRAPEVNETEGGLRGRASSLLTHRALATRLSLYENASKLFLTLIVVVSDSRKRSATEARGEIFRDFFL